jgi:hypothetical protein
MEQEFLSLADAAKRLGCSESSVRAVLISKKTHAFVAAGGWTMLPIQPRRGESSRASGRSNTGSDDLLEIKAIQVTVQPSGVRDVIIKYRDKRIVKTRLVRGVGFLRLHEDHAAVIASGQSTGVPRVYPSGQKSDDAYYKFVRYNRSRDQLSAIKRRIGLADLWLSAIELDKLTHVGMVRGSQRERSSAANSERHSGVRAEVLGAALAVICKWPELVKGNGKTTASDIIQKILLSAKDLWPARGEAPLKYEAMQTHISPYLKRLQKKGAVSS